MAYPYTPTTHSDGQDWTAAKANLLEGAVRDAQLRPAVRVTHSANQSIANATNTALAFNTERFDTFAGSADTQHDTVTNNTRLTCRYAGKYLIVGQARWASNGTGARELSVRLNGATFVAYVNSSALATAILIQNVTTIYDLAVNDYVELVGFQSSGAGLNVDSVGNYSPEFSMVHVA